MVTRTSTVTLAADLGLEMRSGQFKRRPSTDVSGLGTRRTAKRAARWGRGTHVGKKTPRFLFGSERLCCISNKIVRFDTYANNGISVDRF